MLRFFEWTREFRSAVSSVCFRSLFQKCWFLMRQHFWFCNSCIASITSKQSFIVKHTHAYFSLLVCTTPFKTVEYIHLLNAQYAFPMAFLQAWQHLLRVGFKQNTWNNFHHLPSGNYQMSHASKRNEGRTTNHVEMTDGPTINLLGAWNGSYQYFWRDQNLGVPKSTKMYHWRCIARPRQDFDLRSVSG